MLVDINARTLFYDEDKAKYGECKERNIYCIFSLGVGDVLILEMLECVVVGVMLLVMQHM